MKLFNKVAIVGTGLIGGSLALAIKKKRLADEVIGVSRHKKSLLLAKKKGAIDRGAQEIDIIKEADFLILATPPSTIMDLAPGISRIIGKDCIVIDVASTKEKIVPFLSKIFPNYVGSHPLAGSEKRGIINAEAGIFKDSLCILTPTKNTTKRALKKAELLWRRLGTKIVFLSPKSHDKILSFTSHLPHTVVFSLINSIPPGYLKAASAGLKDTTRIASSDSGLWADIFLSNRQNMLKAIELFEAELSRLKSAIQRKDRRRLALILKEAKNKRDKL